MTTTEAAAALGIDRSNVLRAIRRGTLKARKRKTPGAGGMPYYWHIEPEDVEAYRARTQPDGVPRPGLRKGATVRRAKRADVVTKP